MVVLLALLASFLAPTPSVAVAQEVPTQGGYDVVLLAGQSNMVGRGRGDDVPGAAATDPRVFQWVPGRGIVPAVDPLTHQGPSSEVGLGLTFGKTYAAGLPAGRKVLLVGAAQGNTSLISGRWRPGGDLLTGAVARADAAMAAAGPGARFAGVLWHQGETDAINGGADTYQDGLDQIITTFRTQIEGAGDTTPFVAGEFAPEWVTFFDKRPLGPAIRTILRVVHTLPERRDNMAWVSSAGLTSNPGDNVHFDARSQRELGVRYAGRLREAGAGLPQPVVDVRAYGPAPVNVGRSVETAGAVALRGEVRSVVDPQRGPAVRIAGNGSLSVATPPDLLGRSYTKVVWVKLASYGRRNHLLSGEGAVQAHYLYFPQGGTTVAAGHSRTGQVQVSVQATGPTPLGVWTQIAVSYDATSQVMALYADGREVARRAGVLPAPADPGPTSVQLSGYGTREQFGVDGWLADGRVYDRALTAAQIAGLHAGEVDQRRR